MFRRRQPTHNRTALTGPTSADSSSASAPSAIGGGAAQVQYAAVSAALPAGDYTLLSLDGTPTHTLTITGGHVTTLHWDKP